MFAGGDYAILMRSIVLGVRYGPLLRRPFGGPKAWLFPRFRAVHRSTLGSVGRLSRFYLDKRHPELLAGSNAIARVLSALKRFDEAEAEREIGVQLLALGSVEFCRGFVAPLLEEIGEQWAAGRLCPASEHLGSALIRSALGTVLRTTRGRCVGPTALFATPSPEAHELGAFLAAIVAASAGVTPRFLGGSLPVSEIVAASEASSADVVALSVVSTEHSSVAADIGSLRESLPASTEVWVGGRGSPGLVLPTNVERIPTLDELEARARALCLP